jgi:hypothetical protein
MEKTDLEVADMIRAAGESFRQRYSASLTWLQRKVLDAIARCRTAALGGHRDACLNCGTKPRQPQTSPHADTLPRSLQVIRPCHAAKRRTEN